ncbi:MAG: hypothetical protein VB081_02945 [Christensenella sp.]|uniref:hypothetical protein n=1 Tax=Christensenella sp. TaxID=1935934 RepID=UPI002B205CCF|nr:hypothetical protein [Christensenella sp.]MEA5002432.1 hypothetical protein [Christensenella sp.]
MKTCPICKTKFEDSADFCPKCKAQLEEEKVVVKKEKEKIPKSFWFTLLGVFGFILLVILVYNIMYAGIA